MTILHNRKAVLVTGYAVGIGVIIAVVVLVVLAKTGSSANTPLQRSTVSFPHDSHMDFDCMQCHHDYEDGENVLDEDVLNETEPEDTIDLSMAEDPGDNPVKCISCHNDTSDKSEINGMDAYHRQCIGCHKTENIGPTLCGECHISNSEAKGD